jgi:pyruvate dehydrogenase E2 component (dihydrolipoamide acetyltransferase)
MKRDVVMPRMGQSMDEGTLLRWLVQPGDPVKVGDMLVEIETDKTTIEIEAFHSGTLADVLVAEGETVPVGTLLAYIEDGREQTVSSPQPTTSTVAEMATQPGPVTTVAKTLNPSQNGHRILASWAVKRVAREQDIDLSQLTGSGPHGRIVLADLEQVAAVVDQQGERVPASAVARRMAKAHGVSLTTIKGTGPAGRVVKADVQRVLDADMPTMQVAAVPTQVTTGGQLDTLSRIKQATAEIMSVSKRTVPHFYVSVDVDMRSVLELQSQLKQRGHGVTLNDVILFATARSLQRFKQFNATLTDEGFTLCESVNLCVAVAREGEDDTRSGGLLTPTLHGCENLSLVQMATKSRDLVQRARDGKLRLDEMQGGTFTISNLGMLGVRHFEAIINPPQVAILAVGTVRTEAHFDENGAVIPVPTATLTLSANHRVTDGLEVARFLADLRERLEDAYSLLIET